MNLGDLVRDEITGFEGLVLARLECLYEATQCRVHPRKLNDSGDVRTYVWLEEDRLVLVEAHVVIGFRSVAGKVLA